ncbi:uncharacterized protein LOC110185530 [Drosophila serrata]|uniref:uncharacterized protein LOC110185530 n=1 Tax=Drosophila serrata TaxID=7274 RepID=UPI000A1CFE40|nr:uncharacterized protein LOC110185530 [Drosophila serrata]XP_020810097.1 uncharacterized protein LOC110185530 [Drosophila serrata]
MYSPHIALMSVVQADSSRHPAKLRFGRRDSETSFTDPRLEQLIVFRALLENLLRQKTHFENEGEVERLRLERFRSEGASERQLHVQEQVVKKSKVMLPGIVFKMRNEVDKLRRFLNGHEQGLRQLDADLYDQSRDLLQKCQHCLDTL